MQPRFESGKEWLWGSPSDPEQRWGHPCPGPGVLLPKAGRGALRTAGDTLRPQGQPVWTTGARASPEAAWTLGSRILEV